MVGTRGSAPLSLSECEEMLADLQNKYPSEYKVCESNLRHSYDILFLEL